MSLWQNLTALERLAAVQTTAAGKNIEDRAVEKDWWVTAVLNTAASSITSVTSTTILTTLPSLTSFPKALLLKPFAVIITIIW